MIITFILIIHEVVALNISLSILKFESVKLAGKHYC